MADALRSLSLRQLGFAAVSLAVWLAPSAHAADKKPAPSSPPAKSTLLTPAQLKDCLDQKEKLDRDTEAAVKSKAAVTAQDAELESIDKALEVQGATLDRTSEEAVAAYNAKVIERNGKLDAYKARAEAYNVQAEGVLKEKDAYEKACANRRFDDRDLDDLRKKKK